MKTHIHKDKRAWWLSHEAFLLLQELAHQQGLQTAAFLEVISNLFDLTAKTAGKTIRKTACCIAARLS